MRVFWGSSKSVIAKSNMLWTHHFNRILTFITKISCKGRIMQNQLVEKAVDKEVLATNSHIFRNYKRSTCREASKDKQNSKASNNASRKGTGKVLKKNSDLSVHSARLPWRLLCHHHMKYSICLRIKVLYCIRQFDWQNWMNENLLKEVQKMLIISLTKHKLLGYQLQRITYQHE